MTTPTAVAERRTRVRQLAQGGASSRQIAEQLGVSKDTVLRDLAKPEALAQTRTELRAQKLAQAEQAVSQACAAVQAVADARPAYQMTDDETARRWCGALRAAADALAAQADAFADYYPCATG
ncbi:helix-turn-helix domain-containing protein [Streptomyces sp. NPDC059979]|uniref:helix-turn-helix domain-containing protein n=1 Tax=Streptomyces sp. NPDC059979 TaxID=3347021 RepID=UPI0036781B48